MREKYEKFLHFFSISEWDDIGLALDVFDGISNDEFPISLAVFFDVLKPSKKLQLRKAQHPRVFGSGHPNTETIK
jgi:hypothetical protein